jgi:hypothetical protein
LNETVIKETLKQRAITEREALELAQTLKRCERMRAIRENLKLAS